MEERTHAIYALSHPVLDGVFIARKDEIFRVYRSYYFRGGTQTLTADNVVMLTDDPIPINDWLKRNNTGFISGFYPIDEPENLREF